MNNRQKEVLQSQLDDETKVLDELKKVYSKARQDTLEKIKALEARTDVENMQSIVYQKQYQEALKKQLDAILDNMNSNQFTTISDYLGGCYESGYIGTIYDLHGQGIPLTTPINQKQVTKAIQIDSKISEGLYKRLGVNTKKLKDSIRENVSRGIAASESWADVARNIGNRIEIDMNKSFRIARTEGHRILSESAYDAQVAAKKKGADVVKQWDATLDKRTRPSHAALDGKLIEVDERFKSPETGAEGLYPGGFGVASEDVNCRCALLQRAKWALDDDELEELKKRAEYYGLDKAEDFEDFKKKYLSSVRTKEELIESIRNKDIWNGLLPETRDKIVNALENGDERFIELAEKSMDNCRIDWRINEPGTSHYSFGTGHITMYSENDEDALTNILWHEYGHYVDDTKISGADISFITETNSYGTVRKWEWNGASNVVREMGYDDARTNDINNFLNSNGLSDKYYFGKTDEWSNPWMHRSDGTSVNIPGDWDDMAKLEDVLTKKFYDVSGLTEANNYLKDIGYPQDPKFDDYFETYRTPKRQTLKTRPKFKGAEDAWYDALQKVSEAQDEFRETHDMDAIFAEEKRRKNEARSILEKLGAVSDTFDGSAYGAFMSNVVLGGHTPLYYAQNYNHIKEGCANVFSANITGDEDMINAFKEICPETYNIITEAWMKKSGK